MSRTDYKKEDLRNFADLIIESDNNRQKMLEKINGFRMGLTNKYGPFLSRSKQKRIDILIDLVKAFK